MLNLNNISRYKVIAFFVFLTASLLSCSGGKDGGNVKEDSMENAARLSQIAIPEVPDSLTEPGDRADYLLAHFWDSVDFSDSKVLTDSIIMEQGISDFIAIMDFCTQPGLEAGVTKLLDRAYNSSPEAYARVSQLAERYLWEPESPFRSERYYTPFVEYAMSKGGNGAVHAEYRLEEIKRNSPGTVAPDFSVRDRNGRKVSLKEYTRNNPLTILMFYEPDCESCNKVIDALEANEAFIASIAEGGIGFMAVYLGEDETLWRGHAVGLPKEWKVGIDIDQTVDSEDLYVVRATPSFYLIDSSGRIIVKDGTLADLYKTL